MVTICLRAEVSSLWVPTPAGLIPQVPKGKDTTRAAGVRGNQEKDPRRRSHSVQQRSGHPRAQTLLIRGWDGAARAGRSDRQEASGPRLMESRQMFTARWSGTAAEPSQLATQDGRVRGLCALRAGRCRGLPGQFRLPELVLSAPEPHGSSSRAASPCRADLCFYPTLAPHGHRGAPSPPPALPSSPVLPLPSPGDTLSLENSHQAPLPISHPGFFMNTWNWEAGKPSKIASNSRLCQTTATWAPEATWPAQGRSASWQHSRDSNPGLLMTLKGSDDARMSTKGDALLGSK